MYSRHFPTFEDAINYLKERGTLQFFGRAGKHYEYCVYVFHLKNGRKYFVDVYDDGKVVASEANLK